ENRGIDWAAEKCLKLRNGFWISSIVRLKIFFQGRSELRSCGGFRKVAEFAGSRAILLICLQFNPVFVKDSPLSIIGRVVSGGYLNCESVGCLNIFLGQQFHLRNLLAGICLKIMRQQCEVVLV